MNRTRRQDGVWWSPLAPVRRVVGSWCYPAVQDLICGRALLLPLNMVVKPKVLPEPLDRMVMTFPLLSQVGLPFQVEEMRCGEVIATTTAHVLAPLTVTLVL